MFSFDATYQALASHMLQVRASNGGLDGVKLEMFEFTVYDFDRFTRHDIIGNVIMRDVFEKSDLYTWTEYTMHIIGSNVRPALSPA